MLHCQRTGLEVVNLLLDSGSNPNYVKVEMGLDNAGVHVPRSLCDSAFLDFNLLPNLTRGRL